ncbi:MAG TPA: 16S rRNA (adenine(1518)-N(6)/adenine(1519)-N(6))-dimethyltransferase RsmA, partial [Miltoncostaeaceae bacterium]|nr:16S rRNA (adenine(1518)-N(6)/adenine(1519)-N(6))-dimethyltransferase RsmA [Miltoncostaeaceae bacterium]
GSPPATPPASSPGEPGAPGGAGRVGVMRLLAAHGLRPDTDLGQHFLLDENLADLAVREAAVGPDDVALEIGAGLGVLTAALARAARAVHAVEIDRRLEPALGEVVARSRNVIVHWGDAMRMPLEELDPAPTALVSNLPYAIATPAMVESLWRLPTVGRWCVMAQREVVDRWLAPPGGRLYGGPSVLVQLTAETTFRRAVGREVFVPRPRVDSALVALRRVAPGPSPALRALVRAAFASRRKTLVNSLAAAGADKAAVVGALADLGQPPSARPEQVPPAGFAALAEALSWPA